MTAPSATSTWPPTSGAPRIRVFGNAFPAEGINKAEVVENVGAALREIAEHGAARDVDVCLEMHGDFYWWEHTLNAVRVADHPRVGIVHNCDPREMKLRPDRQLLRAR